MKKTVVLFALFFMLISITSCGAQENADLFSDYNGGKSQRIIGEEGNAYSPARCNDVIFYKADKEETLDTVIAEMKKAILEPLMTDAQDRPFTVTAYDVDEQVQLYDLKSMQDFPQGLEIPQWIREYEWDAAADEAWLLPVLEGYYCFEGTDIVSMDILLKEGTARDGMVPFAAQGSEETFQFILMRRDDVYRLQRAQALEDAIKGHE